MKKALPFLVLAAAAAGIYLVWKRGQGSTTTEGDPVKGIAAGWQALFASAFGDAPAAPATPAPAPAPASSAQDNGT